VSCLVGPSVGVLALVLGGLVPPSAAAFTWCTWWVGDTHRRDPLRAVDPRLDRAVGCDDAVASAFRVGTDRRHVRARRRRVRVRQHVGASIASSRISRVDRTASFHTLRKADRRSRRCALRDPRFVRSGHQVFDHEAFRQFTEHTSRATRGCAHSAWGAWVVGGRSRRVREGNGARDFASATRRSPASRRLATANTPSSTYAEPIEENRENDRLRCRFPTPR